MTPERDKKERVIHTRVSEIMDDELKDKAASLGVSVSNLVRNILQHTLGLVEDIVADSASVARSARGERAPEPTWAPEPYVPPPPAPTVEPSVIAWQPAVLNLNAVCAECNAVLLKGTNAAVGISDRAGPRPVLCAACLAALQGGAPGRGEEDA
jgi:hypothetical protein